MWFTKGRFSLASIATLVRATVSCGDFLSDDDGDVDDIGKP